MKERERWHGYPELAQLVPFLIIGRGGTTEGTPADPDSIALPEVSSTAVRAALAAGRRPTALVPKAVLDYIFAEGLYGTEATAQDG